MRELMVKARLANVEKTKKETGPVDVNVGFGDAVNVLHKSLMDIDLVNPNFR